jgi:hypothetical protein
MLVSRGAHDRDATFALAMFNFEGCATARNPKKPRAC